jgi:Glycosyltransferase
MEPVVKRIFAWQTDTSTCHLYRTVFPFEALRDKYGYTVEWGAPPPDIMDYDVIVGQRITGMNDLWRDLAHDYSGLLVLDLDDDLVDVDPSNTVPYSLYQSQKLGTIANIEMADVVTVSTPKLAEKIRKIRGDGNVAVLPNCVHESWIQPNVPNGLTIGYAASPFHQQDWTPAIHQALSAFESGHPEARFHNMGGRYMRTGNTRTTGLQPMEHCLAQMDFWAGLAPLVRNEFNESKSWCKALEYACRGIPVIASDVGQYREWLKDGGGILVLDNKSPAAWLGALETVAEPDLRAEFAELALKRAQAQTIDKHVELWHNVYNGAW